MGKISSKKNNSGKKEGPVSIGETDVEKNTEVNILFLGECGVGKSCIISQFVHGKIDPHCLDARTTAQFIKKEVSFPDKSTLTLLLWDTPGQEKYRSMTKLFIKQAKVVILVYDPTYKESFEELKEYWYDQVRDSDSIIVVAANKCDLTEKKVEEEEGKKFADSVGAIFASISAQKNIGITDLFEKIEGAIKKKN